MIVIKDFFYLGFDNNIFNEVMLVKNDLEISKKTYNY